MGKIDMKFPTISNNIYYLAAALIIGLLFISSPTGQGMQRFLFGNTCELGFYFDGTKCIKAQTNLTCGAGTYLKFDAVRGYSCELSNFSYALIGIMGALAIYFYLRGKKGEQWRPAELCFQNSINGGHLKTKHGNWREAWEKVQEVHQILPRSGWLFIGEIAETGICYSALITGTDDKGWVLDGWAMRLEERQINLLKKQSMKLDQALITVAAEKQRIDKASEAFKAEQEEMG
jgi:hypothetical protein